jgi:hypothetical protein
MDIIHLPVFIYLKHSISETGFCLERTHMGPVDRASPYLQTPAQTQDRIYKPSTAQTIYES